MSTTHTHFRRVLAVTALSLGLSISIAAPASTAVAGGDQMTQAWARRRQEIGIRIAMGAPRRRVAGTPSG